MYSSSEVGAALLKMSETRRASYALDVADFFRVPANLPSLLPLLRQDNTEVLELASWIAGEVVDASCGREFLNVLSRLLNNESASIRFEAIKPIAALLQPSDYKVLTELLLLLADADSGVRCRALRIVCLLNDDVIRGVENHSIWSNARLLLPGVTRSEIVEASESPVIIRQRCAIAGVARNWSGDEEILNEITNHFDDELNRIFATLPKNKKY